MTPTRPARTALALLALAACGAAPAARAQEVRRGLPERPTYEGGFEGFGRFGDDRGLRGFGLDETYRGEGRGWSAPSTAVASGTIGYAYGLSFGPYAGSFTERFGYPDGGGRSVPALPPAPGPR